MEGFVVRVVLGLGDGAGDGEGGGVRGIMSIIVLLSRPNPAAVVKRLRLPPATFSDSGKAEATDQVSSPFFPPAHAFIVTAKKRCLALCHHFFSAFFFARRLSSNFHSAVINKSLILSRFP